MLAREIMIPEPFVAAAGATSAEVALLMVAKDISVVPVVDNPKDRPYLGLISLHPEWRDLVAQYELVAAQARPEWGESTEQLALRGRIEAIARQINDFLLELDQIGCVFKGFDPGLVDFYGKLDGKEMFWCWKVGEERIEHWHELESGYPGRQPIPVTVGGEG